MEVSEVGRVDAPPIGSVATDGKSLWFLGDQTHVFSLKDLGAVPLEEAGPRPPGPPRGRYFSYPPLHILGVDGERVWIIGPGSRISELHDDGSVAAWDLSKSSGYSLQAVARPGLLYVFAQGDLFRLRSGSPDVLSRTPFDSSPGFLQHLAADDLLWIEHQSRAKILGPDLAEIATVEPVPGRFHCLQSGVPSGGSFYVFRRSPNRLERIDGKTGKVAVVDSWLRHAEKWCRANVEPKPSPTSLSTLSYPAVPPVATPDGRVRFVFNAPVPPTRRSIHRYTMWLYDPATDRWEDSLLPKSFQSTSNPSLAWNTDTKAILHCENDQWTPIADLPEAWQKAMIRSESMAVTGKYLYIRTPLGLYRLASAEDVPKQKTVGPQSGQLNVLIAQFEEAERGNDKWLSMQKVYNLGTPEAFAYLCRFAEDPKQPVNDRLNAMLLLKPLATEEPSRIRSTFLRLLDDPQPRIVEEAAAYLSGLATADAIAALQKHWPADRPPAWATMAGLGFIRHMDSPAVKKAFQERIEAPGMPFTKHGVVDLSKWSEIPPKYRARLLGFIKSRPLDRRRLVWLAARSAAAAGSFDALDFLCDRLVVDWPIPSFDFGYIELQLMQRMLGKHRELVPSDEEAARARKIAGDSPTCPVLKNQGRLFVLLDRGHPAADGIFRITVIDAQSHKVIKTVGTGGGQGIPGLAPLKRLDGPQQTTETAVPPKTAQAWRKKYQIVYGKEAKNLKARAPVLVLGIPSRSFGFTTLSGQIDLVLNMDKYPSWRRRWTSEEEIWLKYRGEQLRAIDHLTVEHVQRDGDQIRVLCRRTISTAKERGAAPYLPVACVVLGKLPAAKYQVQWIVKTHHPGDEEHSDGSAGATPTSEKPETLQHSFTVEPATEGTDVRPPAAVEGKRSWADETSLSPELSRKRFNESLERSRGPGFWQTRAIGRQTLRSSEDELYHRLTGGEPNWQISTKALMDKVGWQGWHKDAGAHPATAAQASHSTKQTSAAGILLDRICKAFPIGKHISPDRFSSHLDLPALVRIAETDIDSLLAEGRFGELLIVINPQGFEQFKKTTRMSLRLAEDGSKANDVPTRADYEKYLASCREQDARRCRLDRRRDIIWMIVKKVASTRRQVLVDLLNHEDVSVRWSTTRFLLPNPSLKDEKVVAALQALARDKPRDVRPGKEMSWEQFWRQEIPVLAARVLSHWQVKEE